MKLLITAGEARGRMAPLAYSVPPRGWRGATLAQRKLRLHRRLRYTSARGLLPLTRRQLDCSGSIAQPCGRGDRRWSMPGIGKVGQDRALDTMRVIWHNNKPATMDRPPDRGRGRPRVEARPRKPRAMQVAGRPMPQGTMPPCGASEGPARLRLSPNRWRSRDAPTQHHHGRLHRGRRADGDPPQEDARTDRCRQADGRRTPAATSTRSQFVLGNISESFRGHARPGRVTCERVCTVLRSTAVARRVGACGCPRRASASSPRPGLADAGLRQQHEAAERRR